MEKGNGLIYIQ